MFTVQEATFAIIVLTERDLARLESVRERGLLSDQDAHTLALATLRACQRQGLVTTEAELRQLWDMEEDEEGGTSDAPATL